MLPLASSLSAPFGRSEDRTGALTSLRGTLEAVLLSTGLRGAEPSPAPKPSVFRELGLGSRVKSWERRTACCGKDRERPTDVKTLVGLLVGCFSFYGSAFGK